MAEYLQIGVTAMRDPVTGKPLEAVPIYIKRSDAGKTPAVDLKSFTAVMTEKMKQYLDACHKQGLSL